MKTMAFALRNTKEIVRDKLNMIFGIGFPVVLLLLLSLIQSNIPVELFMIDQLAPGSAVFGLSFMSLFAGTLIAKDRSSSLMLRLFTSPMRSHHFIVGYIVPLLPLAIIQMIVSFIVALLIGLEWNIQILLVIAVNIPMALFFIAIGLLCGSLFNDKQVGGICGALLTNLAAWLSGTWFDPYLVGGVFLNIAEALPFLHAVEAGRHALAGDYQAMLTDFIWVVAYAIGALLISIWVFTKKMNND